MASDIWCYSSSATRCLYSDSVQWKSVLVWVLLVITTLPAVLSQNQGPSTDFSRHQIIRPKIYHARHKREISSTKENDIEHVDVLSVHYELDGVERILDLRLNKDLIPYGYQQRHQHKGTYKVHTPTKVELCQYHGSIRDVPGSWAAISTCNGLQGVIYDGIDLHHIHPEIETLNSKHYIYKHKDLIGNRTCGYEGTPHDFLASDLKKSHRASRHKRATETIRGPYNANRQSRYVELVLVIDKKEYMAFDENLDKVYQRCKDIANIINAFYMPLNVFIALVGVEVWSDSDEIPLSVNGDSTLSSFLRYRRETLVKAIPNDNAQLLTRIQFDGGVVGKALKGPICTYEFSGGVSSDHSNQVGVVAATVAHEIGHNFGMEHDAPSPECECPEERCIMAPSSGSAGPVHWSSCSLDYLALAFEHGMDYCLRNKPQKLFDSPVCGNSFVEPGEQCDCGLKENCNNPCCDASTCMLHANASCATGQCCDLKTCRPKTAGTECRSAEHECDLPEYCTGQSEYCPNDVYKIDGEPCNMGKAYCYQGSCRTHNDQCKLLWGPTGVSSDPQCYSMNNKGNKNGNCGFNRIDSSYYKCNNKSILCGMLHCKHLNERLEFGMESVATLSHSFINSQGNIIACRSAIVDLGLNEVDPGLAPDGAKCGPGKMCVNQKCMPVADLRAKITEGHACPNNCGGNGVCNSLGHCHCNRGFQYPDCTQPGFGGSEDSGPAEDPNARNDFITATYIIFLGVLPTIGLVLFGLWYRRNNPNKQWNKGALSKITRGTLPIKSSDRSNPLPRTIETIDSSLSQDPACASLLPKSDSDERYNNNFFGHFKGFSITPIQNQSHSEPTKPAPLPPTVPTVAIKTNIKPLQRINSFRSALSSPPVNVPTIAPALPPLNPGSTARPLISSPVLAATTCTSLELIGSKNSNPDNPVRPAPDIPSSRAVPDVPTRPAPDPPREKSTRPLSSTTQSSDSSDCPKKEKSEKGKTLNRLASMLRPNSGIIKSTSQPLASNTNSLPRSQHHKANKVIDKEILRNLEISHPIPQTEIEIPTSTILINKNESPEKKISRAHSMRDKVSQRPAIHTFGSMRQSNSLKRPTSIPASTRPTSPPPGPPTAKLETGMKIPGLPGYQTPSIKPNIPDNTYDDCMNLIPDPSLTKIAEESQSTDNIYAVIEEPLPEKKEVQKKQEDTEYKAPKPIGPTTDGPIDSMGLLSEIVSEISNRNFDSIYSTSTIARKKKKKQLEDDTYVNSTSEKTPESIYSNSESGAFNSASSTTSSGYLHPSAINIPLHLKNQKITEKTKQSPEKTKQSPEKTKQSPEKTKPGENFHQPFEKSQGKIENHPKSKNDEKSPTDSKTKTSHQEKLKPVLKTQNSDSNLKEKKNFDKCVPSKERFQSPDVVTSCSNSQNSTKSPDVLINNKITTKVQQKMGNGKKTPIMPPKPTGLLSKAASFAEKQKLSTANFNNNSSSSSSGSSNLTKIAGINVGKNETKSTEMMGIKTSLASKLGNSKSNVASLQQKFEQPVKNSSSSLLLTKSLPVGVKKTQETQATIDKK